MTAVPTPPAPQPTAPPAPATATQPVAQGSPQVPQQGQPAGPPQPAPQQDAAMPPWERGGQEFDPERAWRLIQNVTAERDKAKAARDELGRKVSEFEQASMTEAEKVTRRAETAERDLTATRTENMQLRAAITAGIAAEDADRLRGATLEEMVADAQAFKARYAGQQPRTPVPDPAQGTRSESPETAQDAEYRKFYPTD